MAFLKRLLSKTFVRYVIGGAIAACLHIAIVAVLVEGFGSDKENANSVGFVIGVMVNYLFQAYITFHQDNRDHFQQFPLFIGFAVIGLGVNRFVFSHAIHDFNVQYLVATALAIIVVFMFNFTCNRFVTFRRIDPTDADPLVGERSVQNDRPRRSAS